MTKIEKFEDLKCWQESRKLVRQVFLVCAKGDLAREFTLVNQMKRATLSVMNNIAKGYSRYNQNDFIRFLNYAQSSSQEIKSLLYVLKDMKLLPEAKTQSLQKQCDKTKGLISDLVKHLNRTSRRNNQVRDQQSVYQPRMQDEWDLPNES